MPGVSVIIPNLNGMRWLPGCLRALDAQHFRDFEIIVVDNGSSDESCAWLHTHHPAVRIIQTGNNLGFAAAVNRGIRGTRSPLVALLNNDTEASPEWLLRLHDVLTAAPPDVAGVCGKMVMLEQRDLIENAGDTLAWNGAAEKRGHGKPARDYDQPGEIFSPCAGAVLFRKSFLETAGLFDESFFAYLEDVDLGLRGRLLGFRYLYEPSAVLAHQGHGSNVPSARYVRLTTANRLRLFLKNIPARLLVRHAASILYGQWYFFIVQRRPGSFFLGYVDIIRAWSTIRAQRKSIRALTVLQPRDIDGLLNRRMQQPGLLSALGRRISRRNPR